MIKFLFLELLYHFHQKTYYDYRYYKYIRTKLLIISIICVNFQTNFHDTYNVLDLTRMRTKCVQTLY